MIFKQLSEQLGYLEQLLSGLSVKDYTRKSIYLSGATIGGHTRHILELLGCAVNGYVNGVADYQNRVRDLSLEQDPRSALQLLKRLEQAAQMPDKPMKIVGEGQLADTSYYREIVYNIEHTIHHLALIKVSLVEMGFAEVSEHFGMAYSTIKYNREMATTKQ